MKIVIFLICIIPMALLSQSKYAKTEAEFVFDDENITLKISDYSKAIFTAVEPSFHVKDILNIRFEAEENSYNILGIDLYIKIPESIIDIKQQGSYQSFWKLNDYEFKPFNGSRYDFRFEAEPFQYFLVVRYFKKDTSGQRAFIINANETNSLILNVDQREVKSSTHRIVFDGELNVKVNNWESKKDGNRPIGKSTNPEYEFQINFKNVTCDICQKDIRENEASKEKF